jgi:aminopeptidase YwaD
MRSVLDLLERELSGDRARAHVAEITRHYRSPGSAGYHRVIDYVTSALSDLGVGHTVRTFALDGHNKVGGERTPPGWEPTGAKLELMPAGEVLVRWDECASCLPWWNRPTPAGGVELEVVDVSTGESDHDYAGKDVTGKAVLIHDVGENFAWSDLVARASRHGAAGIVSNYLIYQYEPWRTREALPEAVQQMRLPAHAEMNPWTFCVSQTSFEQIIAASEDSSQPVKVRFTIDAKTFESTSRSVLATIPGTSLDQDAVLFVAHVTAATMPGANCASGVALLLELAGTMTRLIADGLLERPARSIQFLFANEGLGSLELAESDPTLLERLIVAFAFCSVGHDQGKTKSTLIVGRSPDALPTFADDVVESLLDLQTHELPWAYRGKRREIPYVRWKVLPYTPWSDNVTWSKLGVPGLLFMSLPDRYFHTQLLTVDETDPKVFVSCGAVTGTAAYVISDAGWPDVGKIMHVVASRAEHRLAALALEALAFDTGGNARRARLADAVAYVSSRDIANLRSTLRLVREEHLSQATSLVDRLERRVAQRAADVTAEISATHGTLEPAEEDVAVSTVIPTPSSPTAPHGVPGLAYAEMVVLAEQMQRRDPSVVLESLQVIVDGLWSRSDGAADIAAIARNVGHEFDFDLAPHDIYTLARGLELTGYLRLETPA